MTTDTQLTEPKPRRRNAWFIAFTLMLAVVVLWFVIVFIYNHTTHDTPAAFDGDSSQLTSTVVVPSIDSPLPKGKTAIWCSSFQIAWNHLRNDVMKEPIHLAKAQSLAKLLNDGKESEADYPPGTCYAAAGRGDQGIAARIQREMRAFTKGQHIPQFEPLGKHDILSYAYVKANVPFTLPYNDYDEPLSFTDSRGKETSVHSFGLRSVDQNKLKSLHRQAAVLYESETEYIIDPCRTSAPNQIILASIAPHATLAESVAYVQSKIAATTAEPFSEHYVLLISNIKYRISHRYKNLEHDWLLNPTYTSYTITQAQQDIDFCFDKTGTRLESESKFSVPSAAVSATPHREAFIFDHPFLLIMQQRGAMHPFFVMWVDNPELLVKWR